MKKRNFYTRIEYQFWGGKNRLVLKKKKGGKETVPCPFCGCVHIHEINEGHRIPHCGTKEENSCVIALDGTVLYNKDGYILKDMTKTEELFEEIRQVKEKLANASVYSSKYHGHRKKLHNLHKLLQTELSINKALEV